VAEAYGTAVPIGGGATFGKDPRKVDPRGQRMAREMALRLVQSGQAREATVWLAWRPGDVAPKWVEVKTVPPLAGARAASAGSRREGQDPRRVPPPGARGPESPRSIAGATGTLQPDAAHAVRAE